VLHRPPAASRILCFGNETLNARAGRKPIHSNDFSSTVCNEACNAERYMADWCSVHSPLHTA
jgi:hypothetical protein